MKVAILIRDSRNVQDWSGLPYHLCQAFISKYGNEAVIIQAKNYFKIPEFIFNNSIRQLYKIYYKCKGIQIAYSFIGSWLYRLMIQILLYLNRYKINKTGYLFSIIVPYGAERWIKVPIVTLSDASFANLVKWQLNRDLVGPEVIVNNKSFEYCKKATLIVCLFKTVYDDLIQHGIKAERLLFFPGGINLSSSQELSEVLIRNKFEAKTLLFIGRKHYVDGAFKLYSAFNLLRDEIPDLKLVIIGLQQSDIMHANSSSENVKYYSFLDKTISSDYLTYVDALKNATLFINIASIGGAYQATLEALSFGTPVILTEYPELTAFLHNRPSPGILTKSDLNQMELSSIIRRILNDFSKYLVYSNNAYKIAYKLNWLNLVNILEDRFNKFNFKSEQ